MRNFFEHYFLKKVLKNQPFSDFVLKRCPTIGFIRKRDISEH